MYYTGDPLELRPQAYSLVSRYDEAVLETFRLAMEQNPDAGELIVITSAVEDGRYVESMLGPLVSRHEALSLRMIRDFSFEELSAEMEALPRSAVVFFTPVVFDRNGDREVPRELLGRLADASEAAFYTFWGSLVGSGAVGGHVIDGEKTAAEMVRAVMDYHRDGAFKDDYRTLTTLFDWRAMRKHGIGVEKLPEDATILNRPVSVFVSHPKEILTGVIVVVCLFLALALCGLLVIYRKNRQIEEARKEAEELARTDPLTRLLNRRAAMTFINYEMQRHKRAGDAVSVLVLDLDHFKQVNDTYGHEAGDCVLKGVAESLRRSSRETDTVARWGGEELLILLAGTRGCDAALRAEKIRRQTKELTFPSCPSITVSIGVAELKRDEGFDEWFRRADAAMYRAKELGRDRVEIAE